MTLDYAIAHAPAYASLRLDLKVGQTVLVESSAMAAMDPAIAMTSKLRGGLLAGIGRAFGGESLFVSEFAAKDRPGKLYISPGIPGDIRHYDLDGKSLLVQSGGFVAASPTVDLDTRFQGARGFFSGESFFLLRASGRGDFWFSSYGGIVEVPVAGDYVVDTSYVVAFEDSLDYSVEAIGGLAFRSLLRDVRRTVFGGEGLVCRFRGEGRLWIQSRSLFELMNFLQPFRPTKSSD